MLLGCSIICWASQFAGMSLLSIFLPFLQCSILNIADLCEQLDPSRWPVAMVLYMTSFISYGTTLPLYFAVFPRLARNTSHTRSVCRKYENGEVTREEYEREESLEKNRLSNYTAVSNCFLYSI